MRVQIGARYLARPLVPAHPQAGALQVGDLVDALADPGIPLEDVQGA